MDWVYVVMILQFVVFGAAALFCAEKGWHFIGHRQLQRRTEARLREAAWQTLQLQRLDEAHQHRANGATSSERTRGTPSGPRRS